MEDENDRSESPAYVFYRDRSAWSDVTPVPQDEGPNPIVRIAYSERFRDVFDYFRALLKSNECSERALELTQDAADLNPANYTVWQYRREVLKALEKDLKEELAFLAPVIQKNPKNYQVWHHRRAVMEVLRNPEGELDFVRLLLEDDPKNYHAWQYRQWLLQEFDLFSEGEIDYVNELLADDIYNNSAWNQRFFVLSHMQPGFTDEVVKREVEFTKSMIEKAPCNESSWNYLRGILLPTNLRCLQEFCEALYSKGVSSAQLLGFMVSICEERLETGLGERRDEGAGDPGTSQLERALGLCDTLATKVDVIRKNYWAYIGRSLASKYGSKEINPESTVP